MANLSRDDVRKHRVGLCALGIDTAIPEHYECLQRFVRSFTSKGTVNRKQHLTGVTNLKNFGLPKGGGQSDGNRKKK